MLRKWLLKVLQGLDWLDRGVACSWWLLIGAALIVTWEVVMRYVFWAPHDWFPGVSIILCIGVCLLGAGTATRDGQQITLELLYVRLNARWRRVADMVIGLITIIICVIMSVYMLQWAMFLDSRGMHHPDSLGTPLSIMAYAVFAAMALNAIYALGIVLRVSLGMPAVKEAKEEAIVAME